MRAILVLALFFLACKSAEYQSGDLRCALTTPFCPSGFHCASDGTCWLDGADPSVDMAVHVGDRDLGAPDLATMSTLDLTADDSGCAPVDPALCCGTLSTSCGATVNCTGTCLSTQICGGAVANQCGCTTDTRSAIFRAVASDGKTCYSAGDPGLCPSFTVDSTASFYLYAGDPPTGMVPLVRCHDGALYFLSLDVTCGGSSTATVDVALGYVPTSAACGSVALHRYDTGATGMVYTTNPASAPGGATEVMPPFYIWTN